MQFINEETKKKILVITTFPPAECGIATFASDLVTGLEDLDSEFSVRVCALEDEKLKADRKTAYVNDRRVEYVLDSRSRAACLDMASLLNSDRSLSCVLFEHEFGLYGGNYGDNMLALLGLLEKPTIVRFHTVLPGPNRDLRSTVASIATFADRLLVMTSDSKELLIRDYHIPAKKVAVIPHGIHAATSKDRSILREEASIDPDKLVLTNFGLLSENKNIEYALEALAEVKKNYDNFQFLIIGKTHPSIFKYEGEQYRNRLKGLVMKYNLSSQVRFINRFVSLEELLDFLALTDIYLFTSKDPNQAISGTLTYALNAGCAVITTPIVQAKELIAHEAGCIVPYGDVARFASTISDLATDGQLRQKMGNQARQLTSDNSWDKVAARHHRLFWELIYERSADFINLGKLR